MSTLQALLIAILQGATELFPISSLGHAVVVPALLNWHLDQNAPEFLPFLVLLHTGTATALLLYFWRDWLGLLLGTIGQGGAVRVHEARRMLVLIIVATIPAVILGFVLNKVLRTLFGAPLAAAGFLALNGIVLLVGEWLRGRSAHAAAKPLTAMTIPDALAVGIWQCGALLPGISRSGATIVGGLLRGLDHEASAHFSFLIATPIIIGATVLEVPHLLHASVPPGVFQQAAIAAVVAGIVAFLSTAFLMRYFRNHDRVALNPFAYYCLIFGIGSAACLLFR
jgi:undecaprenyl-diphosphatase